MNAMKTTKTNTSRPKGKAPTPKQIAVAKKVEAQVNASLKKMAEEDSKQIVAFQPLSLEEQQAIEHAKEQKKASRRKGPQAGMKIALAEDLQVVQVTAAEHNVDGAPTLAFRRVGKRKLSEAEQRAVLKAGTEVEFMKRQPVRVRAGTSKGEKIDIKVRMDVVRFGEHTIAAQRSHLVLSKDGAQ